MLEIVDSAGNPIKSIPEDTIRPQRAIAFTIADARNMKYAKMMEKSLRKFHSAEELPLVIISGRELEDFLKEDPDFFYRATPKIAKRLFAMEFDLVLKLDADQIITGSLDYILKHDDYDLGTVLNFNPTDRKTFGPITTYNIDCTKYMNCGFVAMRNPKLVDHWLRLCMNDEFFKTLQFREQDIMNILYYYGDYNVTCFDYFDPAEEYSAWHGLLSYGEWLKVKRVGDDLVLPASPDGYPNRDVKIKALHWAHGDVPKMNYKIAFQEDVIKRLDELVK